MNYFFDQSLAPRTGVKLYADAEALTVQLFFMRCHSEEKLENIPENCIYGEDFDPSLAGWLIELFPERTFRLADLWRRKEWKDASVWSVLFTRESHTPVGLFNKSAEALSVRRDANGTAWMLTSNLPIDFVVPYTEATFKDVTFFVHKHPEAKLITNLAFERGGNDAEDVDRLRAKSWPGLVISGPSQIGAGEMVQLEIEARLNDELFEYPLDVELESVNGYLPKSRLRLEGRGVFKVSALGLDAGDWIKVKAGFRYLAAVTEYVLGVV